MSRPTPRAAGRRGPVGSLLGELFDAMKHGRWQLVATILLAAAASGSSVALMGLSGWLLSRAAEMPPVLYLQAAAVGVRFFGISRGVFRYVERLVGHDLALRMQSALRLRTYRTLADTTLIGRRRGDLLTRVVADVSAIQDLIVRVVVPFCSASLVILGTTVMLGRFNWPSSLVLLATALAAGIALPWATARLGEKYDLASVPTRSDLAERTRQIARASEDLVINGADQAALDQALATDAQLRRIEARTSWIRGLTTAGQILASGIAVVAALWIGGAAVASGGLKPRLLAVLVLTPLALHEVFATFTQAAQTLTRSRAALGRLTEVLDEPAIGRGDVAQVGSDQPGVTLSQVTVGWPRPEGGIPTPVITDLDLAVGPGERVALVGPSGVGKTTVAATVMGLIPPLAGQVSAAGRVGYLAQDAHIFATSLAENLKIGNRDATDEQIDAALTAAGLDLAADRVVGEDGATLSGGEARRVALARVLIGERDLWILDEPTEHLDAETATALMADVWTAIGNDPALVITHDADVMADCDRVVRLG